MKKKIITERKKNLQNMHVHVFIAQKKKHNHLV